MRDGRAASLSKGTEQSGIPYHADQSGRHGTAELNMANYAYVAVDPRGAEMRGVLEVPDQSEALRRIKEMGLYPTKVREAGQSRCEANRAPARGGFVGQGLRSHSFRLFRKVGPRLLATFTRQLATLVEAGMPLLRG